MRISFLSRVTVTWSLWTSWATLHSCCSSRSCSLLTRTILSHGQTRSYLLDLFYQAYCYNTVLFSLDAWEKRGLISAFSPHPLIFSSSLSVLCIFLLLQFYFILISDQSLTFYLFLWICCASPFSLASGCNQLPNPIASLSVCIWI